MKDYNFENIMKLEINTTNKLLEYMHSQIDVMEILDELDLDLTYIQDERNNLAFNIWLSVDYLDKNGESFIEKFIREKSGLLSKIEKDILTEKSKSYISLFEILDFNNEHVLLKDILSNKEHKVLEPNIHSVIEIGEFLFTRIGNVFGNTIFMGEINYVPSTVKDLFLGELFIEYNHIRKDFKNMTIVEYLKNYSLDLYKIYNDSLLDAIDMDGDINSYLFDELDEFESFLSNKYRDISIKKHLDNLTHIFEYALADNDMTLYDICRLDLNNLFNEAIEDGFINSHKEFNSYVSTLKNYLHYLSMIDIKYKESYTNILKISKDRFKYMGRLDINSGLKVDDRLSDLLIYNISDDAIDIVLDYDKFILYVSDSNIKLTSTHKKLKRKDLMQLNGILENYSPIIKNAPNQKDFPLIDFFFHLSLHLGVVEINNNSLIFNKKGLSLLRLGEEEKYSILINYLWSKDFLKDVLYNSDVIYIDTIYKSIAEQLSNLNLDDNHYLNPAKIDIFNIYHTYFNFLGLIEIDDDYTTVSFTYLGKKIFNYLKQKREGIEKTEVIKLDDFKKARYNMEG